VRDQPPRFPESGVVRVAADPAALFFPHGEPGRNRFDDPRPISSRPFAIRYAASSLRGCLLELLDWLRPNPEAVLLEDAVTVCAGDRSPMDDRDQTTARAIADYLAGRQVGRLRPAKLTPMHTVSIDSPILQAQLDREPAVRALLDSAEGQTVLAGGGRVPRLDGAAVRLGSVFGRSLTQACSLAIHDRRPRPDAIHYRSRHDDRANCWAIYDHVGVTIRSVPLSPSRVLHRRAMHQVAELWNLSLPDIWA